MIRLLTLCATLICVGCVLPMSGDLEKASGANGAMWGADAHLAPSKPDAILHYADHPRGFAELRLPEGRGPFPLAVIFHGGCFTYGLADQAIMGPIATRWQQEGIASLNVDYREVGDGGGWPGSFEDWASAARLIDTVAKDYPIDRARVTLVGHSAGALPALWLTKKSDAAGPVGAREPTKARAAIVLDGPADLGREEQAFDALCQFSSVEPFMAGHAFASIAPAPQLAQLLFVQAKLPAPGTESLATLGASGTTVAVRINPGASHFSVVTPGDPVYSDNEPAMLKVLRGE